MQDNNGVEARLCNEDELQVATVLANMPYLAPLYSSLLKPKLVDYNHLILHSHTNLPTWSLKKRRSVLPAPKVEDRRSPSTPLSLPLSPSQANNKPKKLSYEKLRDTWDEKLKINQVYKEDVEKVKDLLSKLQARNYWLKQLKEELYGRGGDEERERGEKVTSVSPRQETTSSATVAVNHHLHVGPFQQAQQCSSPVHRPAGEIAIDLNLAPEVVVEQEKPVIGHIVGSDHCAEQERAMTDSSAGKKHALMRHVTNQQDPVMQEQEQLPVTRAVDQEQMMSDLAAVQKRALMLHTAEQQQPRMSLIPEQQKVQPVMWYPAVEHQMPLPAKLNRKRRLDIQRHKQQRRLFSAT